MIIWRVPFAGLRAAFHNLEIGSLFLALFSFLVLLFLRGYKWHRLLAAAGKDHLCRSMRTLFGGFALGVITPGRLGELGRCVFVRDEERAQVALLTVLDRLLDFWALLTLMSVSLFLLASRPAAVFGVAVWLAFLPVALGFPALVSHISKFVRTSRHIGGHFTEVAVGMPLVSIPRFAILAVSAMGVELASFFFLLRAFSPTEFATALATYPYIALAADLPVSFSGVGVREGVAALLLSPYAVPSGAAVDASLVWFVFAMLLPAAIGAFWLVAERAKSRVRKGDESTREVDPALTRLPPPQSRTLLGPENVAPRCDVV